jgi:hypothetical protein
MELFKFDNSRIEVRNIVLATLDYNVTSLLTHEQTNQNAEAKILLNNNETNTLDAAGLELHTK